MFSGTIPTYHGYRSIPDTPSASHREASSGWIVTPLRTRFPPPVRVRMFRHTPCLRRRAVRRLLATLMAATVIVHLKAYRGALTGRLYKDEITLLLPDAGACLGRGGNKALLVPLRRGR